MRQSKYSYASIISNFDLEPVIADYFAKYPDCDFIDYEIVFRTRDEHREGTFSYLIVFTLNGGKRKDRMTFYDFIKSYIEYRTKVQKEKVFVSMHPHNNVLATPGSGHTFGDYKE